jgi:ParB family chromosome partitioning protein
MPTWMRNYSWCGATSSPSSWPAKTPPKGAAIFVADCLARDPCLLTNHHGLDTTAALLGVDGADVATLVAGRPAGGDARAQVLILALVLGALETRTPKDAWRNATPSWSHHASSSDYLRWLADNDYPLAPVEEVITTAKTSEGVYQDHCS